MIRRGGDPYQNLLLNPTVVGIPIAILGVTLIQYEIAVGQKS